MESDKSTPCRSTTGSLSSLEGTPSYTSHHRVKRPGSLDLSSVTKSVRFQEDSTTAEVESEFQLFGGHRKDSCESCRKMRNVIVWLRIPKIQYEESCSNAIQQIERKNMLLKIVLGFLYICITAAVFGLIASRVITRR